MSKTYIIVLHTVTYDLGYATQLYTIMTAFPSINCKQVIQNIGYKYLYWPI